MGSRLFVQSLILSLNGMDKVGGLGGFLLLRLLYLLMSIASEGLAPSYCECCFNYRLSLLSSQWLKNCRRSPFRCSRRPVSRPELSFMSRPDGNAHAS